MNQTNEQTSTDVKRSNLLANIAIGSDGSPVPKNVQEQLIVADGYIRSGMLPKGYETAGQVVTAMTFAAELGIPGIVGLRQIAVINGQPSIWGDLPLALCIKSGQLDYIKEFIIDDDMNPICWANKNLKATPFAAICLVKRKGQDEEHSTHFSVDDAKTAGLWGNSKKDPWIKYPKIMLKYRARSQALKDKFPDALNGVNIAEYDFDMLPTSSGIFEVAERSGQSFQPEISAKSIINNIKNSARDKNG